MYKKKYLSAPVLILLFIGFTSNSFAAEEVIEEVTVIGSRSPGRSAENIPVPVDILNAEAPAATDAPAEAAEKPQNNTAEG